MSFSCRSLPFCHNGQYGKKNIWRREETKRVRESRVITSYIEFKHPEVYNEAKEFYMELNKRYPNKKDLRRTNEFEWIKTGFPEVKTKKYYTRKTQYGKNKGKKDNSKTDQIVDNMNLVIPLMDRPGKTVEQTTAETIPKTNQGVLENVVDMSPDKEIEVIIEPAQVMIEPAEVIMDQAEVMIEPTEVMIDAFPPIPDKMVEDIIKGLREDPDLHEIFNELDIEIDEESPLERELALW